MGSRPMLDEEIHVPVGMNTVDPGVSVCDQISRVKVSSAHCPVTLVTYSNDLSEHSRN